MRRDDIEHAAQRDVAGCAAMAFVVLFILAACVVCYLAAPWLVAWSGPDLNAGVRMP